jgi:hypothetical protein
MRVLIYLLPLAATPVAILALIGRYTRDAITRTRFIDWLAGEWMPDVPVGHRALRDALAVAEEVHRRRQLRLRPWLAAPSERGPLVP